MKVLFLYLAQPHQVPHSFPIAAEMMLHHPQIEVHVGCSTAMQEQIVLDLAKLYPLARVHVRRLRDPLPRWLRDLGFFKDSLPPKILTLLMNRNYLRQFDAVVVPERTSLFIRYLGLGDLKLVWTRHGAGDRAIGYSKNARGFDFVLMAGTKHERRLLEQGIIRPGDYHVGCYAKFDIVRRLEQRPRRFDNTRTTVLYNPHFLPTLSSWQQVGFEVLEYFACSDRYNLIFAPHIRLFDPPSAAVIASFDRFCSLPNLHIDLGSARSIDMSYTTEADIYLGDVSSQVAEFLCVPRPCVFLNPHRFDWRGSPNFLFWKCGQVLDDVSMLSAALEQAFTRQQEFEGEQNRYFSDTFSAPVGEPTARAGADAIVNYLQRSGRV